MKAFFQINIFKLALTIAIVLAAITRIFSQTYEIDNLNGLTTNTCIGTFYDSGGSGSQYGNNENYTTTFCSGTGQCIDFDFTAFRTDGAGDVLTVYDGPSTASPVIGTYSGNLGGFGSITSSGTCLTFRFVSDASGLRAGWSATISCITKECPTSTSITPLGTQTICQNNAASALSASVPVTGTCGTPTIQYQWYSNSIGGNTISSSTAIGGATSVNYTPPTTVLGTTYYFCVGYAANNGCSQTSTTQSQASNSIQITIVAPPTTSVAGSDQSICTGSTATLAANTPTIGTGTWSVTSGPSTSSAQFSNTTLSNAVFTPAGGAGTYILRWTISNAPCTASTDEVSITVTCGGGCPACPTNYLHPTTGIANENVGSCLVSDCGPFNYYDTGGPTGNYATGASVGGIYRVFCPSTAGNCMQVTFNAFNTEASIDYLTVGNGPTQNSTLFTTPPANGLGRISGTPAVPFTYTSSHSSGCLTFRFRTDASVVSSGWAAVLTCVPCASGPSGTDNNDCINATGICSNASIASNSTGPGIVAEGCSGVVCPAGGENHTNWYKIKAATTGPLDILVTPTVATDDYDIAIYGPNVTCGALGSPIRCTDSGNTGNTGAIGTPGDNSEDVTGDKFINRLNVIAGEEYYIMIDEWTPTGAGYTLSFPVIAGGASLDCVVLPVELSIFEATYNIEEKGADLHWRTESERNNDYFTIEKSKNGIDYSELAIVDGAGTTNYSSDYYAYDPNVESGVTYYRLKQTDIDGKFKYSEIKTINVLSEDNDKLTLFPNPTCNKTELVFNCYHNEIALLTVSDSKGFVMFTKEVICKKGSNNYSIDLTDYSNGLYILNLATSTKVYTNRLIKE